MDVKTILIVGEGMFLFHYQIKFLLSYLLFYWQLNGYFHHKRKTFLSSVKNKQWSGKSKTPAEDC